MNANFPINNVGAGGMRAKFLYTRANSISSEQPPLLQAPSVPIMPPLFQN